MTAEYFSILYLMKKYQITSLCKISNVWKIVIASSTWIFYQVNLDHALNSIFTIYDLNFPS